MSGINKIEILAADSMGVRSLATYLIACNYKILIDAGASLAPRRYGLPPHPLEEEALEKSLKIIKRKLEKSDVAVISHYHYDHYLRNDPELYTDKKLFIKDPKRNINRSQAIRAWRFLKKSGLESSAEIYVADSETYQLGELILSFSKPVWHGDIGTKVGKVVMLKVQCGQDVLIFSSDVQGPADPEALKILRSWSVPRPKVLILCGPPTYFSGFKVPEESVVKGLSSVEAVIHDVRPLTLILDHHLIRDANYENYMKKFKKLGKTYGVQVLTAAEFMGSSPQPLEAWRKKLWKEN